MRPIPKQRTTCRRGRKEERCIDSRAELAAWTMVASEMLNLDETVNK
jgi:hypothetical protein